MIPDKRLLDVLVCPVSKSGLRVLSKDRLAILNRCIEAGEIANASGKKLDEPLEGALMTMDGKTLYAVRDGIPVMLADEGVTAAQVPGW